MADTPLTAAVTNRFLGISGGGWNSHSVASGLISGALAGLSKRENRAIDLGTLMADVDGLSANSGGSWFLTQMAYSPSFRQALESEAGRNSWNSTGYNGQVAELFNNNTKQAVDVLKSLQSKSSRQVAKNFLKLPTEILYWIGIAQGLASTGVNWRNVVDRYAFGPYGMVGELANKTLSSARETWSRGKDLVIAAAAQSAPAVMDQVGLLANKIFAAVTSPDVPGIESSQVTPLSLVSDSSADGSSIQAKAVLTAGNTQTLIYSNNKWFANPASSSGSIPASSGSKASVIDATTASSAAVALYTAPKTYEAIKWMPAFLANQLTYLARDLSPLGQFTGGEFSMPKQLPDGMNRETASTEQVMQRYQEAGLARLADGGYVDNTSAAYMLKQIQESIGSSAEFNLTIFMNSTVDPLTGIKMQTGPNQQSSYWVPRDVGRLFGNSNGNNNDGAVTAFDAYPNPPVVAPTIFKKEAWYGEDPVWKTSSSSIDMSYFDLNVETVANAALGIQGGQKGRLHLFVTNNKDSLAAPATTGILGQYANNYDFVRDWVSQGVGLDAIQSAFGLS